MAGLSTAVLHTQFKDSTEDTVNKLFILLYRMDITNPANNLTNERRFFFSEE